MRRQKTELAVNGDKLKLILLVHTKMAALEWGKVVLESFYRQAVEKRILLQTVHRWQEIPDDNSTVILLGVDEGWLFENLDHIDFAKRHVILLCGIVSRFGQRVSRVLTDQGLFVEESLACLKQHGRRHTALFGIQKKDTSDELKAATFARLVSEEDIFYVSKDRDVDVCFEEFYSRLHRYDSVICSNDLMAIYLLGCLRKCKIEVPRQLYLIGNCNLWLGAHVTPALTTISYDTEALVMLGLQMCKSFARFEVLTNMDITLKGKLLERESTGGSRQDPEPYTVQNLFVSDAGLEICPGLGRIQRLNQILSSWSPEKRMVLQLLINGMSYGQIASCVALSVDTVKSHIQKLYKSLEIHSRKEFCEIVETYGIRLL